MVLQAAPAVKSLAHVSRSLVAGRGGAGGPQRRHGRIGQDLVVDVPLGTVVYLDVAQERQPEGQPSEQQWQQEQQIAQVPNTAGGAEAGVHSHAAKSQSAQPSSADGSTDSSDNAEAARLQPELAVVADLVQSGERVIVAAGGNGGRGNATFRNAQNRPASKQHEIGVAGLCLP